MNNLSIQQNISTVFVPASGLYLNEYTLFAAYFNEIPNNIIESQIDSKKAHDWFYENYKTAIKAHHYCKRVIDYDKFAQLDTVFYVWDVDLIVVFEICSEVVKFLFAKTSQSTVDRLVAEIQKFRIKRSPSKPVISLVVNTEEGLSIRGVQIPKHKQNISLNYNDDFKEVNKLIVKRLNKKEDKGLVLLHGNPGTGKTSYIRHLIASVNKQVIFLPPNMANVITNPELMTLLIRWDNSVLVIEDAENLVIDRETNGNSPVSALLNLADGLLSDCLNIQVVCSFNTDISKVDNALMRKGRLIAKYEFKELEASKAQTLSNKLGFDTVINQPMTLTDIYNQKEKSFQQTTKRKIGF